MSAIGYAGDGSVANPFVLPSVQFWNLLWQMRAWDDMANRFPSRIPEIRKQARSIIRKHYQMLYDDCCIKEA